MLILSVENHSYAWHGGTQKSEAGVVPWLWGQVRYIVFPYDKTNMNLCMSQRPQNCFEGIWDKNLLPIFEEVGKIQPMFYLSSVLQLDVCKIPLYIVLLIWRTEFLFIFFFNFGTDFKCLLLLVRNFRYLWKLCKKISMRGQEREIERKSDQLEILGPWTLTRWEILVSVPLLWRSLLYLESNSFRDYLTVQQLQMSSGH